MKKIIITLLSAFALGGSSHAQSISEILQISQNQNLGTARFNGLSGAFGALGGDLTAISQNPAGSAVFLNSYGSLTLARGGGISRSSYLGTVTEKDDATFDFNQVGGVLILKNTSGSGPSKIALGLTYDKTNDFRDEFQISGDATNSIADYFVGQANGIDVDNFNLRNNETLRQAYQSIGNDPNLGFSGQQGFLGFQGFLISDSSATTYTSEIIGNTTKQVIDIETGGSKGKVTFNVAAEFEKNIYLGANFNIHNLNYDKTVVFDEFNKNSSRNIDSATFINQIETNGSGISFDFGAITKLSDEVRVGLSYQTPVYYELEDSYSQQLSTFFSDGETQFVDPNTVIVLPIYEFRTPGTISGSIAYIIGKKGLLSAQYSRKDYSNIKYTSEGNAFDELNSIIKNTFQAINTFRIGGEYRYENWRFRGGLSKITSPYKNDRIIGDTNGFSLGTGYNLGKWKLDIAYNHVESDRVETLFENASFNNSATVNKKDDAVSMTLGVNF